MSEASSMSDRKTCADTTAAISSPGSEGGTTPSTSRDGTDLFGQALARVNRFPPPAKAMSLAMSATYGRHGSGSSASLALTQSLASRYRARTHSLGSTMFDLTWKARVTPSRFWIPAQRASARRISGSGCTSWPSPNAGPQNDNDSTWEQRREDLKAKHMNGNGFGLTLGMAASLSPWPTPNTPSGGRSVDPSKMSATGMTTDGRKHTVSLEHVARFASWPTPKESDSDKGVRTMRGAEKELERKGPGSDLPTMAAATWATPTSRDLKDGACDLANVPVNALLGRRARLTDSGATPSGSHAETAKRGQLNPALSRWLQAFPQEWCDCADMAMRSMPKRHGSSSKPMPPAKVVRGR